MIPRHGPTANLFPVKPGTPVGTQAPQAVPAPKPPTVPGLTGRAPYGSGGYTPTRVQGSQTPNK